ncbi:MAG TPA: hypothetical protein VK519_15325 [Pinirhizobacter sp.]|uniref:hypothetical protein n=1 Tax=Pinirhizobacter sp. TaxID=2950432 RepID=UPI002CD97FB2|nr:hypothetical protein [Pinirhizobacter sp.]HMH69281.1 hypothetical protein [Pinirhizobacter sp.]
MLFTALSAMALAAATPVGLPTTSQTAPVYVDAIDYPGDEDGWSTFYDLERRLARGFNDICGDTFCEGEYSNIQHLRYRCSVRLADGVMGECIWTFAGSNQEVDPTSGKVVVDGRIWQCKSPIVPGTTIGEFYRALAGRDAIDARLPRGGRSIYHGLTDCGF